MRRDTCVVIPVCFPAHIAADQAAETLRDTVAACCSQVQNPSAICLSVDGRDLGGALAAQVAGEFGATTVVAEKNRGKLAAAAAGVRHLGDGRAWRYFAVIDQDGDHFANELVNFVRVAEHVRDQTAQERVLVLGRRSSRHRPMGLLRGELEELADRVLLDALGYDAVVRQRPLALEYVFTSDEFPDFHSGYKLFSRVTAQDVFMGEPNLCGVSEDCYYRHAVEAVMTVEALVHGAYLGIVTRSTFNEQPFSTFGVLERCRLVADKMIWPLLRLNVPPAFARQWLANHIPRLLLSTLAPQGKEELQRIAALVLDGCGGKADDARGFLQPLFV